MGVTHTAAVVHTGVSRRGTDVTGMKRKKYKLGMTTLNIKFNQVVNVKMLFFDW